MEFYVGPPRPVSARVAAALGLSETCSTEEVLSAINSLMQERLIEAGLKSPADVIAALEAQREAILEFHRGELREFEEDAQETERVALAAMKALESTAEESRALLAILQALRNVIARLDRIESVIENPPGGDSLPEVE